MQFACALEGLPDGQIAVNDDVQKRSVNVAAAALAAVALFHRRRVVFYAVAIRGLLLGFAGFLTALAWFFTVTFFACATFIACCE